MNDMIVNLHIEELDEGGYVGTSPDVPGLVAQGQTLAETIGIARDVAKKIVESCEEYGEPMPWDKCR